MKVLAGLVSLYRDDKKKIRLDVEFYSSPLGVVLYRDFNWHWEPPYELLDIGQEQRELIIEEVTEHFRSKGYEVQIR